MIRAFLILACLVLVALVSGKSSWNLEGKNVLITGGSKGIGKACVQEFLELGANVVTCARNQEDLDACMEEMKEYVDKGKLHTTSADVSTEAGRKDLVVFCNEKFKGNDYAAQMHCLVNNVGFNIRKKSEEFSSDEYESIMKTNLDSAFYLSQMCNPLLSQQVSGNNKASSSIVNIGSVAGGCGVSMKSGVVYAMTKAAMVQMTYNMACEWATSGIRVNTVSPWYVERV
jgi:Tropinone reductase 1